MDSNLERRREQEDDAVGAAHEDRDGALLALEEVRAPEPAVTDRDRLRDDLPPAAANQWPVPEIHSNP